MRLKAPTCRRRTTRTSSTGKGWFRNGDQRHQFAAGDVIFAASGVTHRFEDFSDDFATWVVFYGPKGGEA
jgi:quercetin dioxygenase-like cupin family protein